MKKLYMFTLIYFIPTIGSAQFKVGPKIGLNICGATTNQSSTTVNLYTSFSGGIVGEFNFLDKLAIQANFLISSKGYNYLDVQENKSNNTSQNTFSKSSVVTSRGTRSYLYLDFPVYLLYKKDLGIGKAFVGAGGYLAYAVWGVDKSQTTYVVGASNDLSLSSINDTYDLEKSNELNKVDGGLVFTLGLEFNERLQLQGLYQLGLTDIDASDRVVRNWNFNISLAYLLGK